MQSTGIPAPTDQFGGHHTCSKSRRPWLPAPYIIIDRFPISGCDRTGARNWRYAVPAPTDTRPGLGRCGGGWPHVRHCRRAQGRQEGRLGDAGLWAEGETIPTEDPCRGEGVQCQTEATIIPRTGGYQATRSSTRADQGASSGRMLPQTAASGQAG